MLEVLDWFKKDADDSAGPTSKPASAEGSLAGLRGADPATALAELGGWLEPASGADRDPQARIEKLAQIQEAGAAHVSALLAQYLANAAGTQAARESAWKSLLHYQSQLTQALAASAQALMNAAKVDRSLLLPGAASVARALQACRTFTKVGLIHYSSAPGSLWHLAYSLHALAEAAGCADLQIRAHADQKNPDTSVTWAVTTVSQELLRLLMLQMSAPDMLAPEQIEIADRVVERVGGDFTLRTHGIADNPFCFEPDSNAPPRRAPVARTELRPALRYFGPGMGFDALERMRKQLASGRLQDIKAFGMDIAPAVQLSAIQHLLLFWHTTCPYSPPPHTGATGSLETFHRYAQVWQRLSGAQRGAGELALADEGQGPPQAAETWSLRDAGGNELGAELAHSSGGWAKCGAVISLSPGGSGDCWIGVIRRMHAEPRGSLRADIAVLSRKPLALLLREVLDYGEEQAFSNAASRQFALGSVRSIILADGAENSQPPNLLLPPESWKEGRIYEVQGDGNPRYLRGLQVVRRGDDYVRATFEWVPGPS